MGNQSLTATNPFNVSEHLRRIVRNLLRYIPDPPKPVARPSKSFAGLKVGQRLADPELTRWQVVSTDSQGANMVSEHGTHCRIEARDWKGGTIWARVRTPRKRKVTP